MAAMNVRAPITPYMMALQEKCIKGTIVRLRASEPRLPLAGRPVTWPATSRSTSWEPHLRLEEINEGFSALRSGQWRAAWGCSSGHGRIVYAAAMSHVLHPPYYEKNVGPHGKRMVEELIAVVGEMGASCRRGGPTRW